MLLTFRTKLVAIVVTAALAQLLLIFASAAIANQADGRSSAIANSSPVTVIAPFVPLIKISSALPP